MWNESLLTLTIRDFSNDAGLSTTWKTGGDEPMICQRQSKRITPVKNRTTWRQMRYFIQARGSSFCCNKQTYTEMLAAGKHWGLFLATLDTVHIYFCQYRGNSHKAATESWPWHDSNRRTGHLFSSFWTTQSTLTLHLPSSFAITCCTWCTLQNNLTLFLNKHCSS